MNDNQLRPCMISFNFPPDYSGSAVQALNLSRHLQNLGLKPFVVAANLSGSPPEDTIEGIPVFRLPVSANHQRRISSFGLALLRFLVARRSDYDLIHAHGALTHTVAGIAGRLLHKPTILKIAMADSDIAFQRQGRIAGRINRELVKRFDAYIATTTSIESEFAAQGLDVGRVRLKPNAVDTDSFTPVGAAVRSQLRQKLLRVRQSPLSPADKRFVIYVGVINRRKNIDGILRIWQTVCAAQASSELLLVGPPPADDDPFKRELDEFIHTANLADRVRFLGFKDPVVPYLQAADAFLFPSRQEGMANSVLEAMACGLPCLVSDAAGVAAIISHGENGYKFPVEDEASFAHALVEVLTNDELRQRLSARARRTTVEQFSIQSTAEWYRDLYRQLCSNDLARGHRATSAFVSCD